METVARAAPTSRHRFSSAFARRARSAALGPAIALLLAGASTVSADVGDRLPKLGRLRDAAVRADGALAYEALRKLWREWDQGDPAEVEEALREVGDAPSVTPPVRTYAHLLEAYARRRRGDLDGARARIARLGYVGRWDVIGPFDNEGKGGLDRAFGPEEDRLDAATLLRTYDGKERSLRWRAANDASPYGWVDFGALVRPAEKGCAYAATFVHGARAAQGKAAPPEERPISIWAGSAGAMRVFWNGVEVLRDEKYRELDSDRLAVTVQMHAGYNRLLVKACGDDDAPIFSLRLAGADGAPDATIESDPDPTHLHEPAEGSARTSAKGLGREPKAVEAAERGPLMELDRAAKSGDPAKVEALARYLVATQSDDPSERRARDLAAKAATAAPTIPRLLLAGELAENRNQRAVWIERAEALVGPATPDDDRIAVLLARAAHTRGGANWRDAVPFYDRVLSIDPDNVTATLARVELFTQAGLRETALAVLDRALVRRPRSVALVRAMAAALTAEERTTEADEMSERYAALRFDDAGYVRERLKLAVARRDVAGAARWVDRLVAMYPDHATSYDVAAKAFMALGDRPRAIAMYRKALDLAPEDTDTMRALADVYALGGQSDDQLKLLRKILELRPQDKDVREYVAHAEPGKPRADEKYARPATEFLAGRDAPSGGENQRTLVDLNVTTVFPNGLASRFHQVVFQPLTDAAAASGREYAFGFEADTETVQLRGARVYRKDGKIDEAIESGEGGADNPSLATYTSERAFYVHFPRLNPGDVVELLYRVEDVAPRNAFADYFGEVVYLQSAEPLARAEYVLITPKARTFYFNQPNVPGLEKTVDETGDSRVYTFVARDQKPVTGEPHQPPYAEILGHVHVSTYKSWEDVGRWYWGFVKDQFVADDEVRRRVAEVTKGLTDERAKVRAVYDDVVQKTRYVALEFGIHGFKPYRCAQIFARGFGDCKDKATLIVTMLKELGIPATIVIVRTGLKGDFDTAPASLAPFDHAIAYVPSLDLYLDGTAEWTGSTELPEMDRGSLAMQINEGQTKLVHLPDPPASESVVAKKVDLTVAADGAAQLDWHLDVSGVRASAYRQRYHAASTRKQRLQEDLGAEFPGLEIASIETNDLEDLEQKVAIHVKGKVARLVRRDGKELSVPVGPTEHLVRDDASLSRRRLDLRLGAQTTSETEWTIHVPAGFTLKSSAAPAHASGAYGAYAVETQTGADGAVRTKTTVAVTKTRVPASDYAAYRQWCEEVDRALGQRATFVGK